MKLFLTLLAFVPLFLWSCLDEPKVVYPQYTYGKEKRIPDSLRMKYAEWVKQTVAAASSHMTAGDYEDPEDVISQAEETGERIFEVEAEGLYIIAREGEWRRFIPKEDLTPEELKILEKLKR